MATYQEFQSGFSGGAASSQFTLKLEVSRVSADAAANWSKVRGKLRTTATPGSYWSGNTSRNSNLNSVSIGNATGSFTSNSGGGDTTIFDWSGDITINHDVNGNASFPVYAFLSATYPGSSTISSTFTLDRLPLAPMNSTPEASNIGVREARLTAKSSSNGHGTSVSYNIRYRKQGDGTWIERGWGGATWDVTNLTPGTTYEFAGRARNNNSDTAAWTSIFTFTTLPAPSTSAVLLKIIGVL